MTMAGLGRRGTVLGVVLVLVIGVAGGALGYALGRQAAAPAASGDRMYFPSSAAEADEDARALSELAAVFVMLENAGDLDALVALSAGPLQEAILAGFYPDWDGLVTVQGAESLPGLMVGVARVAVERPSDGASLVQFITAERTEDGWVIIGSWREDL